MHQNRRGAKIFTTQITYKKDTKNTLERRTIWTSLKRSRIFLDKTENKISKTDFKRYQKDRLFEIKKDRMSDFSEEIKRIFQENTKRI